MRAITHSRRLSGWVIAVIAVVVLGVGGAAGYYFATRDTNPLPQDVRAKLDFTPLILQTDSKDFTASQYKINTVEDGTKILTYVVSGGNDIKVTVSEYVQPTQFTDIPEYKDRFLSGVAQQYDTVPTSTGIVYLGRMAKQNNAQLAVMIENGLLVLMNPSKELNSDQWRSIVEQFKLQKN